MPPSSKQALFILLFITAITFHHSHGRRIRSLSVENFTDQQQRSVFRPNNNKHNAHDAPPSSSLAYSSRNGETPPPSWDSLTMSPSEVRYDQTSPQYTPTTASLSSSASLASGLYDPFRDFIAMESRAPVRVKVPSTSPTAFSATPSSLSFMKADDNSGDRAPTSNDSRRNKNRLFQRHSQAQNVQQQQQQKCEFQLEPRGGNLTSLGYPANYLPNQNCLYRIRQLDPSVCQLWLRFAFFELLNSTKQSEFYITHKLECTGDYLEFDDRVRFCGALSWPGKMETVEIDQSKTEFVFRFRSDSSHSGGGFNIEYRPIKNSCYDDKPSVSSSTNDSASTDSNKNMEVLDKIVEPQLNCGEKHSEMEFEIMSPGFPNHNYTNGLDCVHYVIRNSPEICGLEVKFVKFELEESEGCTFDFVEIDGESFCGRLPEDSRNIFDFHSSTKTISFQTDLKNRFKGFHLKVRQLKNCENSFMPLHYYDNRDNNGVGQAERDKNFGAERPPTANNNNKAKCQFITQDKKGELSSIFYPNPYPPEVECLYMIKNFDSKQFCSVTLNFHDFNLKYTDDCRDDYFEINEQKYCGDVLRNSNKILDFNEQPTIKLYFKSSANFSKNDDFRGFALNYTLNECQDDLIVPGEQLMNVPSSKNVCEKRYSIKTFMLSSDSTVNGTYPDNSDCRYVIEKHSQKVCYVELSFKKFDLEASPDCQYDYVEVGQAVRLCGTLQSETSRIYRFLDPEMVITFHSDSSNSRDGFKIEVEQLECEGERIVRQSVERLESDKKPVTPLPVVSTPKPETGDSLQSLDSAKNESKIYKMERQQQQQQQLSEEFDLNKSPSSHPMGDCNRVHDEREFFLESPGFPGHYSVDQDCIFIIKPYSPTVCKLEFSFDQFELQPYDFEKNCHKSDYLDMDSREMLCGSRSRDRKLYQFLNSSFYVHFHSDSFPTSFDRGFRLFVRQIDCSSSTSDTVPADKTDLGTKGTTFSRCNRVYTTQAFEIKSPLYPTPYMSNSQCMYRIIKNRDVKVCFLEFQFIDFDLEESPNCSKDSLTLNGMRLCGPIRKNSVRLLPFQESEFILQFNSDPSGSGKGFYLQVRQIECSGSSGATKAQLPAPLLPHSSPHQIVEANQRCQKVIDAETFELENPNYPNYYLPALSCTYLIRRRNSRICQIELLFLDLDIEPTDNCSEDYLLVDGTKYCNNNRPPTGTLVLPFFEVEKRFHFRSSSFRRRKGYLVQGKQIDCTLQQPKPWSSLIDTAGGTSGGQFSQEKLVFLPSLPSICEICVTQVNGNIQSYDYPNFYPPNVNCSYSITPLPDNCMVKITFDKFDFDYSPECNQDYLEINGVRYCGNQLQGVSMLLLNKRREDLSIRMVSNARGALIKPSFQGFRASYNQLPCLEDTNPTQPKLPQIPRPDIKGGSSDVRDLRPNKPDQEPKHEKPVSKPMSEPSARPNSGTKTNDRSESIRPIPVPPTRSPHMPAKHFEQEPIFCDETFEQSRFEIKSPGYPYRYYDKLNCVYTVQKSAPNVCRLKLNFNYFNVIGEDGECNGDYLNVFSSKICGVLERHTKKEIPFVQDSIVMNFYTNDARTSNGFHVTVEQIQCSIVNESPTRIAQDSDNNNNNNNNSSNDNRNRPEMKTKPRESLTPSKPLQNHSLDEEPETPKQKPPTHNKEAEPGLNQLKYDDEPHEPMETHPSTQSPPIPETIKKRPIDVTGVVYAPKRQEIVQKIDNDFSVKGGGPGRGMAIEMPRKPIEQHRQRIPGPDVKGGHTTRTEPEAPQKRPDILLGGEHRTICNERVIDKMYFELKSSDLKRDNSMGASACQLNIKKSRPNICQLDVMFVRYELSDSSCGQQYVSIDGERVCGRVPENGVKKFWFIRSDMLVFAKLSPALTFGSEEKFHLKIRQVECSEQQQQGIGTQSDTKGGRYSFKGQSFFSSKNEQKKFDDFEQSPKKEPEVLENMNTEDPVDRKGDYDPYCDLIATDPEYKIVSPRRPSPLKCRYTIRKISNNICAVDIRFSKFRLEDSPDGVCDKEHMEIDSGKICGTFPANHERRYYFLPNEMEKMIYFVSNRSQSVPGDFVVNVKQIDDCSKPLVPKPQLSTPTICDMTSASQRGSFKSPNYPSPYDGFTRCTYRIKQYSSDYCKVRLILRDLDIERDLRNGCVKDSLEFHGEQICGRNPAQKEYLIPFEQVNGQKSIQLKFSSDGTGNGRGFNLEYSQERCHREEMPSPVMNNNYPHHHQQQHREYDTRFMQHQTVEDTSGLKSSPSSHGVRFVPMSPVSNSRTMQSKVSSTSLKNQAMNDPNSLGRSPMRPFYPPNYVSKAHLVRQMDRKEFIKMLMTEQEREQFKIDDDNFDVREPESITQEREPGYSMPSEKTRIEQFKLKSEMQLSKYKKNDDPKTPPKTTKITDNQLQESKPKNLNESKEMDTKVDIALPTVSMVMKYDNESIGSTTGSSIEVGEAPTTTTTELPAITTINSMIQV